MYRAALAEQPDLLHLFKPKGYGGLAALLIHTFHQKLPLFVDTDDWEGDGGMNELHPYSSFEKKFYAWQEQSLLTVADGVTVASRALEQLVRERAGASGRIIYIPNGVNNTEYGDRTTARIHFGFAEETPVVLLYTRFFEFDQERLYTVMEGIFKQVAGVRFLVVGAGRHGEEQRLAEVAAERGFSHALILAGWIEPQQLPDILACGDVALYLFEDTLLNRCKCPAKLTELMLAGIPVVADRVGQIEEYIKDGESGILCQPGDWQEMAQQVTMLLNHPERRQVLALAAQMRIVNNFAWSDAAEQLEALYVSIKKDSL